MVNWSKIAFVFPGQGSQEVGMGKDFVSEYPAARAVFEQADEILGFKFSDLCFDGPEDELNDTINTQPAIYICGVAILRALESIQPDARPLLVAGHSLGEFTALVAAGAVSFEEGLRVVRERGRLMKAADEQSPGAMAALLGLNADVVSDICARASQETGGVLVLANDNCPGQVVISGDDATLDVALVLAKEAKVKKAVKLQISIAAHSPLMEPAAAMFRQTLAGVTFHTPLMPLYGNLTAAPLTSVDAIRHELDAQLTGSVRWTESVQAMVAAGAEQFIELGPRDVLVGLLKRIDRGVSGVALNSTENLRHFAEERGENH